MLTIIRDSKQLMSKRSSLTEKVGFVPTMGNLHLGHLSLLDRALKESHVVVFSIFVNPKQFAPHEDFNQYPRTFEQDVEKINQALIKYENKKILLFTPRDSKEIFPPSFDLNVSVYKLNSLLEGAFRPTHFDGVTTVLYQLFQLIKPHKAYFGLKDFQQYTIVKKMVHDLQLPIEIEGLPIYREANGLAMSSRNQYLTTDQREVSSLIYQTLCSIKKIINSRKENLPLALMEIKKIKQQSPQNWNYLEIIHPETLESDLEKANKAQIVAAYQLGQIRLLDNISVEFQA